MYTATQGVGPGCPVPRSLMRRWRCRFESPATPSGALEGAPRGFAAVRKRPTDVRGQKRRFDPMPATSGLPRTTDVIRPARLVRFVPGAETFTALRKAAARSAETICVTIGEILRALTPTECANYFRNSGYAQS